MAHTNPVPCNYIDKAKPKSRRNIQPAFSFTILVIGASNARWYASSMLTLHIDIRIQSVLAALPAAVQLTKMSSR
jgi:hypothetical protein